jgi:hypothetical protein
MALKKLLVALSSLAAAAAMAQSLGTVSNVQGIVTATQGATLALNNGCVVTLQPGQAVTVLQSMTCQQLTAAVQAVPVAPAAAVAAGATPAIVTGFGLAVGLGALQDATSNNENLSPN